VDHLLKTTTLSAMEIAAMSGYTCYPYFITRFKERHGFTTREYRENLRRQAMENSPKKKNRKRHMNKDVDI
jgi:AraC-like DNA-binding protein